MSRKAELKDRSPESVRQFVNFAHPEEVVDQLIRDGAIISRIASKDFAADEIGRDLMSDLRDRFALAALSGVSDAYFNDVSRKTQEYLENKKLNNSVNVELTAIAKSCWMIADAMIKERSR